MMLIKQKELYTARYDKVFKTIMLNNKEVLEKVLETVLKRPIVIVRYVVQELPVRKGSEKAKTMDLIVKSGSEYLNVEVNTSVGVATRLRNLNYFTSFFSQNTIAGEKYDVTTKFIQINLTFGMNNDNKEMISEHKLRSENGEVYYENFEVVEVNMDKVMKIWYSKDEKEIEENKYLIMLDLKTIEELEVLSKGDKVMEKFKEDIVTLNSNATFVRNITPEEDERLVRNTEIYLAKEEAREQKEIEVAKEMLEDNVSIEKISKYTGLSIEEIKELENE